MTADNDYDREEQALDALIVLALRPDLWGEEGLPDPHELEPALTAQDRRALAALGPDLVERLLKGTRRPRPRRAPRGRANGAAGLTGSLHRANEPGELTDRAREEMERKVRELEETDGADQGDRP